MIKYIFMILFLLNSYALAEIGLRPDEWATPVIGSSLDNLYALDNNVYRSEQPDNKAFLELELFGIKEVLNLRRFFSDADDAENTQLKLHQIKTNAGDITTEEILEALKIIKNSQGPILIHCWHGSDRTGIVSAAYRIVFQDWSKENAIRELKDGGFGYHSNIYPNIIDTLNTLDVDSLKRELGI